MKKILFFSHDANLLGASKSLVELVEGLNSTNLFNCKIILPYKGPLEDLLKLKGIQYKIKMYQPCGIYEYTGKSKWRDLIIIWRKLFIRWRNRIVNLVGIPGILWMDKRFKPDLVYFNTSVSFFPIFLFSRRGVKTIIHIREYGKLDHKFVHDFKGWSFRKGISKANIVLCNSFAVQTYYNKEYAIVPPVIYNGVCNESEFMTRKDIYFAKNIHRDLKRQGEFWIGNVGRINKNKGQLEVLQAFIILIKSFPFLRLCFYGSGPMEEPLKKVVLANNLHDVVTFNGFVSNIEDIYPNIDLLIMSSKHEAFGRVTVEAMSFGIPVIGLNSGGTPEIIKDGMGLLYDGSIPDLVEKIQLLVQDKELCQKYSANAWEFARDNFSQEKYVASFISLIAEHLET